jgi:hypothetical protein
MAATTTQPYLSSKVFLVQNVDVKCPYLTLLCRIPFSSLLRTKGKRFETTIKDELGFTFSWVGFKGVPSNIVAVGDIFHTVSFLISQFKQLIVLDD